MQKARAICVTLCIATLIQLITACGGGGGGSGTSDGGGGCTLTLEEIQAIDNINDLPPECLLSLPRPETNLLGRIFVLGTQIDPASGALRIFVNGTDIDGNPLQLANFQTATVSINDIPANPALVAVDPIADGDDVLSMGFVTDYSTSISNAELNAISGVYSQILANLIPPRLPQIMEGQVINFSNSAVVVQDWTEDVALLDAAFLDDGGIMRDQTAFYDALGVTLQRDLVLDNEGLVERCRPAHMLVAYTDGGENASVTYTKGTVQSIIDDSKAVMIMLGGLSADKDMLVELAGDQGAFVYAYSLSDVEDVVGKWASSLSHMAKYTLDSATGFDTGAITIQLGSETVIVERPVDSFCESAL
jgi:hypothetical protein